MCVSVCVSMHLCLSVIDSTNWYMGRKNKYWYLFLSGNLDFGLENSGKNHGTFFWDFCGNPGKQASILRKIVIFKLPGHETEYLLAPTQFLVALGSQAYRVIKFCHLTYCGPVISYGDLTHWGRDKMDAISQTTFLYAFSWMKMFEYRLKFHWSLFLRVQLTIS